MIKKISNAFFLTGILYFVNPAHSFSQAFSNGSTCFSVGYGVGTFVTSILDVTNSLTNGSNQVNGTQAGPLYLKAEQGISDHIGFGINFAYLYNQWTYSQQLTNSSGYPVTYSSSESRAAYSIMARINFHFGNNPKIDPYFGFGMGYRNATWKSITNAPTNTLSDVNTEIPEPFAFEATIGIKYLVTPNFGLYMEGGFAKSAFQGGLVFNLPGKEPANTPQPILR